MCELRRNKIIKKHEREKFRSINSIYDLTIYKNTGRNENFNY